MMRTQIGSSLVLEVKNFDIDLPGGWGGGGGLEHQRGWHPTALYASCYGSHFETN